MISKVRGFEQVKPEFRVYSSKYYEPTQGTIGSAGWDICSPISIDVEPGKLVRIATDVKSYMPRYECLKLYIRSSVASKGLEQITGVTIIDSDFYNNSTNDGNITLMFRNTSNETISIKEGDKLVQGIFEKWLPADSGRSTRRRTGGIGSTGVR